MPLPCGFSRPSHPYASSGPKPSTSNKAQTGSSAAWARLSSPLLPTLPRDGWMNSVLWAGGLESPVPWGHTPPNSLSSSEHPRSRAQGSCDNIARIPRSLCPAILIMHSPPHPCQAAFGIRETPNLHGGWQSWHLPQAAGTFSNKAVPFGVEVMNARCLSLVGSLAGYWGCSGKQAQLPLVGCPGQPWTTQPSSSRLASFEGKLIR